jgi:hypothetical protein
MSRSLLLNGYELVFLKKCFGVDYNLGDDRHATGAWGKNMRWIAAIYCRFGHFGVRQFVAFLGILECGNSLPLFSFWGIKRKRR